MTVRPVRCFGDPGLRTPCDPVSRFDDSLTALIQDLLDTVQEPGRAGLAANQIGSTLSAFAYNVDGKFGYLINPRIIEVNGTAAGLEGCLSLPGISALRRRSASAVATGLNLDQDEVTVTGADELARCLQHEIDHLRGELFIDALEPEERRRVMLEIYSEQIVGDGPQARRPAD